MRVVVLGGGYAGLLTTKLLEQHLPDHAELVVVDDTGSHLIQHEVHRVIRKPALDDTLTIPLDELFSDVTVRTATVTDIDPSTQCIELGDESIEYDAAAVCLGARTTDHGIPGIREHGLPLKSVADAHSIREQTLPLLDDGGTIIVGGAGLSGIQVAGELAALRTAHQAEERLDIQLLEQQSRIAPGFPARFQDAVRHQLTDRGVDIRTKTAITEADASQVTIENTTTMGFDSLVWTGGIEGTPALDTERPRIRSDLKLGPNTFIAGDAGDIIDTDGERVPATAQAAVREANVCAHNILATLDVDNESLDRFRFKNLGWLVSVGDGAVAQVGPSILTGAPAKAMKATVGLRYLTSAGATREALRVVRAEFYD